MSTCSNGGTLVAGTCSCPPGLGGPSCASLACGNALEAPAKRTLLQPSAAGSNGTSGCGQQCTAGWVGPTCNTCTQDSACAGSLSSITGARTGGVSSPTSNDVVCSKSPEAFTESFGTCGVVNPTLQAVFPGSTTLTFQKTPQPALALSYPYGTNGTFQAQLWYAKDAASTIEEQFFCAANSCVQSNSTTTIDWTCQNLQCTCIPGTAICGKGGIDLTNTINGLSGSIAISCSSTSTSSCAFKQTLLNSLFGQDGLGLTGCASGECVKTSTINALRAQLATGGGPATAPLDSGVIGGLAVLGVIVLGLLSLFLAGFVSQRKARKAGARGRVFEKAGVSMSWRHLGYSLPSSSSSSRLLSIFSRASRRSVGDDGKTLLDDISGSVEAGELLAVIGPSGAGKSTFIDILAGKRKAGRVTGVVELEGETNGKVTIGYVDQESILSATSTVRECLMFAAELKLGDGIDKQTKQGRVFEVLTQLGLLDVADSLVGDSERRGISGGERCRLSIGLELVAAPDILILDEPTSGLDSSSAMKVISVLKSLSSRTTVITTIHQPSSRIFSHFDKLLVLGLGGRVVYCGQADAAGEHFAGMGMSCPEGWNMADHLLEIASQPALRFSSTGTASEKLTTPPLSPSLDITSTSAQLKSTTSSHDDTRFVPVLHSGYPPLQQERALLGEAPTRGTARQTRKPKTVLLTQIQVLSLREMRNLKRDWSLVIMHNAVSIVVGLFVGGIYYQTNLTIGGFQSRIGSLFFLGSLLAFSSLSALSNFAAVRQLFLRERAAGMYSPGAWLVSRIVFDLIPLRLLPTLILGTIVYWMVGLYPTAANFFKFLLILVEFNFATTFFNLLLAAAIRDTGVAILVSSVLNLVQMAYAGFFVSLSNIPSVLRWLQWLDPLKFMLEALSVNEVSSGLIIKDVLAGVPVQVNAELIMETLFGFNPTAYYRDVLVLFAFIVGFFVLLAGTVYVKLRELR